MYMKEKARHKRAYELLLWGFALALCIAAGLSFYKNRAAIRVYYEQHKSEKLTDSAAGAFLASELDGYGTEANPFLIRTKKDFMLLDKLARDGVTCEAFTFRQAQDLKLGGADWDSLYKPYRGISFRGHYDGAGHTISGFVLSTDGASLFGNVQGTISDLKVSGVTVKAERSAALVTTLGSSGLVEGCSTDCETGLVLNKSGKILSAEQAGQNAEEERAENKRNSTAVFRNYALYIISFALIIALCLTRFKKYNVKKTVFYSLMLASLGAILMFGVLSHGKAVMNLLYPVRENGRYKVFTDFFDNFPPGFRPYLPLKEGDPASFYPPLTALAFAVAGAFMRQQDLISPLAARDSQLGSICFIMYAAVLTVFLYSVIKKYKKGRGAEKALFILVFMTSFPMLYGIERANIALICPALMTVFLFGYRSEKTGVRHTAYIALAAAAGIKLYPAALGLLLIREKRWKETLTCISYGIVINMVPALFLKTGLSSFAYLAINGTAYSVGNFNVGRKVDLIHLARIPQAVVSGLPSFLNPLNYMTAVRLVFLILCLAVILKSKMEEWKVSAVIILMIIVLGAFSPYYYLTYMLAPAMMFLDSRQKSKAEDCVYALLFTGIFMTFGSTHLYPFGTLSRGEGITNMALITGGAALLFFLVLLLNGIFSCMHRKIQKEA